MAIEGLQVVLEKDPVVATPTADRLVSAPEMVEATFQRHVRSYLPFGRSGGGSDEHLSVTDYEARLIELVKRGAAPKGYISADYGYGKTSTALYLWDRCRSAKLLAVPPFQLGALDDFIHATYGWARYEIGRRVPGLVPPVEALFWEYTERSVETYAGGDAEYAAKLRALIEHGQLSLHLTATDYVTFFERIAALAEEAGFEGLVILPDEVQQYVEPKIRGGHGDPIAPLHNLVEAMNTRKGQLRAGVIFSIPRKELGVVNDQRGDLVQRLKADRLGLDLGAVYDKDFASRLWQRLAAEFEFQAEADRVVTAATLRALGQIAARDDLANGPRTVIAAFVHMTRRYLEADGRARPLDPIGLVDAFLTGAIPFDGTSKLQQVINQHQQNELIRGRPEFGQVIKLLAAFPTDGATRDVLSEAGLWEPASELQRMAQGDIVIVVGGGRDSRGEAVPFGLTLRGLEPSAGVASDWLTQTIREFSRSYIEQAENTIERTERAFVRILTSLVFRPPDWKLEETTARRRTDAATAALLFRGSFSATKKRFPERRVCVRLLRDGDLPPSARRDIDFTLDVVLRRHLDRDGRERRALPGTLTILGADHARFELNLFHQAAEEFYPDLRATLQPVVSPYQVTPLLMLALDEYLEEKRRDNLIPKEADRDVEQIFQPSLREHSADELFGAELGAPLDARRERIWEALFRRLCEGRFPEYRTVIAQQGWQNALRDYRTALERLNDRYERQGEADVTTTKEELARRFNRANVAFDSFAQTFPDLIAIVTPFKGRAPGAVRFRLHPFEQRVRDLLRRSEQTATVSIAGQPQIIHVANLDLIYHSGRNLGYRDEEIGALLEIMQQRELVEVSAQHGTIREVAHLALRQDDLAIEVEHAAQRLATLLRVFPEEQVLTNQLKYVRGMQQRLRQADTPFDDRTIRAYTTNLRHFERERDQLLATKLAAMQEAARRLTQASHPDPRLAYELRVPIDGPFFAPQLDALRLILLRDGNNLIARQDDVKQRAVKLLSRLTDDAPDDQAIRGGLAELEILEGTSRQIEGEGAALEERCAQLTAARRVLTKAVALDGRLATAHADDPDLRTALAAILGGVQVELSSRKLAALAHAGRWETELMALDVRLNERLATQQRAFEQRRSRYVELLHRHAGLPPDRMPFGTTYNPLDPDGSARALVAELVALLASRLGRAVTQITDWSVVLRQVLSQGDLAYTNDAAQHQRAAKALLTDLSEAAALAQHLSDQLARTAAATGDRAAADGGEDDRFDEPLRCYGSFIAQLPKIHERYQAIVSAAKTHQLTEDERGILGTIAAHAASDGGAVDVGQLLLARSNGGEKNADEIWPLVLGLYKKRRVRITVAPLNNE